MPGACSGECPSLISDLFDQAALPGRLLDSRLKTVRIRDASFHTEGCERFLLALGIKLGIVQLVAGALDVIPDGCRSVLTLLGGCRCLIQFLDCRQCVGSIQRNAS